MKSVKPKSISKPRKKVSKVKASPDDDVQVLFRGDPKSLLALENFSQVAERLKDFQVKASKEIEAIAEEHRVLLKIDMVFDLKAKPKARS